jgi:hypothetical protein
MNNWLLYEIINVALSNEDDIRAHNSLKAVGLLER